MITVEIAVIIPIITILIVGVVFMFLFFVDMAVVKGETVRITDEVADCWKTEAKLSTGEYKEEKLIKRDVYFLVKNKRAALISQAEKRLGERLKERLILTEIAGQSVKIQSDKVVATANVRFLWPLGNLFDYMGVEGLYFSGRSVSPIHNQEEQLRKIKSKQNQDEVKK